MDKKVVYQESKVVMMINEMLIVHKSKSPIGKRGIVTCWTKKRVLDDDDDDIGNDVYHWVEA